jgi:WD40 repeat protein/predicted Ser/Thr protein kinase
VTEPTCPEANDLSRARAAFGEFLRSREPGVPADVSGFCLLQPEYARVLGFSAAVDEISRLASEFEKRASDPAQATGFIGRFRVLEKLGEGGFGVVYLAEQREPVRRRVAVKVMKFGLNSASAIARFEAEQQALALMSHPSVAKVFDAGSTEQGLPYFVLEYVPGVSITEYCDAHRLRTLERLELFIDVCDAIQHAHQKGIIHRDIKPSNVLVGDEDGKRSAKVIDFGVAKAIHQQLTDRTVFTQHGALIGTPLYMSPEQSGGRDQDVDTRSDIYSLGVLLYEILVGELPFEPEQKGSVVFSEMLRLIRDVDPARPSARLSGLGDLGRDAATKRRTDIRSLRRQLRGGLDWIVMKALEKDRVRRYASCSELAADIRRYIADEPILAGPPHVVYRLRKFARRNRGPLAAIAAILVLLVAGLIASLVLYGRAKTNYELAERRRSETEEALARAERKSTIANLAAVLLNVEARNLTEARRRLEDCPSAQRGFEWHHLALSLDPSLARLTGHRDEVNQVALDAEGEHAVTASLDGTIRVWDLETSETVAMCGGHVGGAFAVDVHGDRIVSGAGDAAIRIIDLVSGALRATFRGHELQVRTVRWDATGRRIISGSYDKTLRIWEPDVSTTAMRIFRGHKGAVFAAIFAPDGRHIVSASSDGTIRVWDLEDEKAVRTLRGHTAAVISIAFDADGRRLVSSSWDHTVRVWDFASGVETRVLEGHGSQVSSAAFSPDGRRIASAGSEFTVRLWDADSGGEIAILRGHSDSVLSVVWHPDGERLVSAGRDGTPRVWDAATRGAIAVVSAHRDFVFRVAVTGDGKRLVTASEDRKARLWDAGTSELLATLEGHGGSVGDVAVSRDGALIATASDDGSIGVWEGAGARRIHTLAAHRAAVNTVAIDPEGEVLVSGGDDLTVRIWEARNGRLAATLSGHEAPVNTVAITSDGARIISGSGARDDRELDTSVRVWDVKSHEELLVLRGHQARVISVAVRHDGQLAASASDDTDVRTWDLERGVELRVLRGHTRRVLHVAFDSDGKRLISGSADSTVRIWDPDAGDCLAVFPFERNVVFSVTFSPDGKRVFSTHADGTLRIWESELATARVLWKATAARER